VFKNAFPRLGAAAKAFIKNAFVAEDLKTTFDYDRLHKTHLQFDAFSTLLHFESYDGENELYVNRDSVGFVIEIAPLGGADQTTYAQLQGLFQNILPAGSSFQTLLIASHRVGNFYDRWSNARKDSIYGELAEKRIEFLKAQTGYTPTTPGFSPRDVRIVMSYSIPSKKYDKFEAKKIAELKKKIVNLLRSVHGDPTLLKPSGLKLFLSDILEIGDGLNKTQHELNLLDPLNKQIIEQQQQFDVGSDGIYQNASNQMASKQVASKQNALDKISSRNTGPVKIRCIKRRCLKMFHVTRYPRHWVQSFMDHFLGDPMNDFMQIGCPFFLHYGVHIVDDPNLPSKMLAKSSHIDQMANSNMAKWVPKIVEENQEWQFVREQFEEGQRIVRTRFQAGLIGDADYIHDEGESQLKALFITNKWEVEADVAQLPALISALPMSWGAGAFKDSEFFNKTKTVLSSEPVNLLPMQGEWKGTESPGMMLFGRRGQVFNWHPFDNKGGNYNVCVLGKSGAGKSVFMQELMFSTLGLGGKVFVFDSGKSFKKVTDIFDGEFIDFGERDVCINPFNFVVGSDAHEIDDALITLKAIVATMACNRDVLSDLDLSFIDQAIKHVWLAKNNQGSIDDVMNYLKAHESPVANVLGEKLFPYSSQGAFGRIFCGTSTLKFDKKIIVLEMAGVNKELLDVIIQILITKINSELYLGDRKTPSHIFLDEGWKFLKGAETKEFIDASVRQLRKFNGSLVIGTQSLGDLFENEAASAAYENSDCICYLSQKSSSVDQQIKAGRLNLSDHQKTLLQSLKMKQGEYSEVMITMNDELYAVGRLKLDPFSNMLYSTKSDEFEAVETYMKQGLSVAQSVERVLKDKSQQTKGVK